MAEVNFWKRFQQLIPGGVRVVATVLSVQTASGTSVVQFRNGNTVRVQGVSVPVNSMAFIVDGLITGVAPNLTQYSVTV